MDAIRFIAEVRGTRARWVSLLALLDGAAVAVVTILTYLARFEGVVPPAYSQYIAHFVALSIAVYLLFAWAFGLYNLVLRFVGVDAMLRVAATTIASVGVLVVADILWAMASDGLRPIPLGVIAIQSVFAFLALATIRGGVRTIAHLRASARHDGARLLIIGAGSAGSLLLREIHNRADLNVDVVGFLDDNPRLKGLSMGGVRVLGTTDDLGRIAREREIDQVFVALPSANRDRIRQILNEAADLGLTTRIMPKIVIQRGSVSLTDMRKVDVEDLLGRDLTPIDSQAVSATLTGKVVAVTGAAGSIGSELCRQIVEMAPSRLALVEMDESRLYELWVELEATHPGVSEMHLLDIRSADKVERVFANIKPDVVLHAAAYKQVPVMELEPSEAFLANVVGTHNVMQAAHRNGCKRFVLISTDKAVAPANVMGKTKQLAERLLLSTFPDDPEAICVAVRFGNVLGSRGSVVPIFEDKLRRGEPLTVTDPEVTRYFMMVPEAARLVLQAQAIGTLHDIFVLEMGEPVRIMELAQKMIALSGVPADIVVTGLRPGEKLHESLHNPGERLTPTERDKISRIAELGLEPLDPALFAELTAEAKAGTLTTERLMSA